MRFFPPTIFSLGFVLLSVPAAAARDVSASEAMKLAREAAAAAEAKDYPAYLAKMEAAVALRPDFPRMLVNLAAAQLAAERADDALATLERLAATGLSSPVEKSEDFAALRPRKEFQAVVKKLAANLHPRGAGVFENRRHIAEDDFAARQCAMAE